MKTNIFQVRILVDSPQFTEISSHREVHETQHYLQWQKLLPNRNFRHPDPKKCFHKTQTIPNCQFEIKLLKKTLKLGHTQSPLLRRYRFNQ